VLDWLSDEAIHFSLVGVVYDTVHFPEGFEVLFPASRAALEAYFSAVEDAAQLPKKTSPGCTTPREFRVILLCPTVLFGAQTHNAGVEGSSPSLSTNSISAVAISAWIADSL
jgi:hypothetical protein